MPENKKFWKFCNQAGNKVELLLYGDISQTSWWGDEVTPKQFAEELAGLGALDEITVRINSGSSAPYTETTPGLYGILAEDAASGEDGIVYLSGEFFADALVLPANATAADVEVPLRNLGIYLK